jgi:Protein of unknown function (DUF2911)
MKNLFKQLMAATFLFAAFNSSSQNTDEVTFNPNQVKDSTKKSLPARAIGVIGGDSITINYYSPGVRGRVIWGGLVPFNEVWVTGAHHATTIEISRAFTVSGKQIPAGKYGFFTIPGIDEWILILNKNWDQHLADDYNPADDLVRLKVKPLKSPHTERLQYFIEPGKGKNGVMAVAWEKIRVELPLELK